MSTTISHRCPPQSTTSHCCLLLSSLVYHYLKLSIVVFKCPPLFSTSPSLSAAVHHHSFIQRPPDLNRLSERRPTRQCRRLIRRHAPLHSPLQPGAYPSRTAFPSQELRHDTIARIVRTSSLCSAPEKPVWMRF